MRYMIKLYKLFFLYQNKSKYKLKKQMLNAVDKFPTQLYRTQLE